MMASNITIVGHRGAPAYLPDNTLVSLEQALREKADMIEFDVRQTRDGELVLFHDWNIDSADGLIRPVETVDYAELADYCAAKGFQLARLEEVLIRFGGKIKMNIELKASGYEEKTLKTVSSITGHHEIVYSSFFPWVLLKLKHIDSSIKTGWIVGQEQVLFLNRFGGPLVKMIFGYCRADAAHLQYDIITKNLVEYFKRKDVPVFAWTIDDFRVALKMIDYGVDGIITNRPGELRTFLNTRNTVAR